MQSQCVELKHSGTDKEHTSSLNHYFKKAMFTTLTSTKCLIIIDDTSKMNGEITSAFYCLAFIPAHKKEYSSFCLLFSGNM